MANNKNPAGKGSLRRIGVPGLPSRNPSNYVEMPSLVPGLKGPQFVSRALRPGGYAEGGPIKRGGAGTTTFSEYPVTDNGPSADNIHLPVQENKLGKATGLRAAAAPNSLQIRPVSSGKKVPFDGGPGAVAASSHRVRPRGNGIARKGHSRA